MDGSFSTLVQSLASEERIEGGAWLGKRIATLEDILSGGHLTRDEQIDAAWRAKGAAERAASWGLVIRTDNHWLGRLLDAFDE